MNTGLLIAFLVTTTIAMIVPGPDMLFVLAVGLRDGPKLALLATSGVATGEALHITLAAAGLSATDVRLVRPGRPRRPWAVTRSARFIGSVRM